MPALPLAAILGVGQALIGGFSSLFGSDDNNARAEQQKLERIAANSPVKKQSPELLQYYNQAQSRYQENPFTTPYYLESIKQADRASASALGAMQSRGGAIGAIGKINQGVMDAKGRGIAGAVQNKNAQFSQYGQAAQARAAEGNQLFSINQQAPYERMLQLQQMKAQAANDRYNSGMNTFAQGISNATQYLTAKEMYNPSVKVDKSSLISNSASSYKTPASTNWGTKTYDFVTPKASANPSAAYSNYMDFSKNPLASKYSAPKNYNPYGLGF